MISESTMCLLILVMMSRQLRVISESIRSTNIDVTMSTNLKHLIMCYSFGLMKVRFLTIKTIIRMCSISSISVTS